MACINPEHWKLVTYEKGKNSLFTPEDKDSF